MNNSGLDKLGSLVEGRATMLGHVHARLLHLSGHTKEPGRLENDEGDEHETAGPRNVRKAENEAGNKLGAVSIECTGGAELWSGEERSGYNAPEAAATMDSKRIQRVINFADVKGRLRSGKVDKAAKEPNENSSPRVHGRASCGDTDKSSKDAVAQHANVPGVRDQELVNDNDRATTGRCRKRGSADGAGHGASRSSQTEGRARVEAIPSDPEDESTEDLERGVRRGHGDGL
mmetsp:Transcript_28155/g.64772  ORF Transcript_28155/g.64772 Transcript_28155/m.64772 type:complete len:232 (+) Transcript_28155:362-1057(+)